MNAILDAGHKCHVFEFDSWTFSLWSPSSVSWTGIKQLLLHISQHFRLCVYRKSHVFDWDLLWLQRGTVWGTSHFLEVCCNPQSRDNNFKCGWKCTSLCYWYHVERLAYRPERCIRFSMCPITSRCWECQSGAAWIDSPANVDTCQEISGSAAGVRGQLVRLEKFAYLPLSLVLEYSLNLCSCCITRTRRSTLHLTDN